MIERTLVLIKPDGVQRSLIGEIISRFEKVGLKIKGIKMVWINKDFSKKHYSAHVGKHFYPPTEDYITSGPVIAMVLEGVHSIMLVRKMVGDTEPNKAMPGTIRGDFAHMSMKYADDKKISVKNLIHASGNKEDAEKEIKLWFKDEELHTYNTAHQEHLF